LGHRLRELLTKEPSGRVLDRRRNREKEEAVAHKFPVELQFLLAVGKLRPQPSAYQSPALLEISVALWAEEIGRLLEMLVVASKQGRGG